MPRNRCESRRRSRAGITCLVATMLLVCVCTTNGTLAQEPEVVSCEHRRAVADLKRIGAGELLWKSGRGLIPLPATELSVDLEVSGIMVHGRLSQSFHNPTPEVIEAVYAFPLPDRAAVQHMELRIGERRIVAVIREREEARKAYVEARSTGRKAALVDQERPNLFTTSAANINPGESVSVVLKYVQEVDYVDGTFSLRFPLTFMPRFAAPAGTDAELPVHFCSAVSRRSARETSAPRATVRVHLDAGMSLELIESESHTIDSVAAGRAYFVRTDPEQIVADRDFVLVWKPRLGEEPRAVVFAEERQGERFALIMLMPPARGSEAGLGLPTETLFVIDVSGSMKGSSIRQARQALLAALDQLRAEDRFNLIKFNDDNEAFRSEFQQATPDSLEPAREWVRGLEAGGGTMIYPALMRSLAAMGDSRSSHAQRIVFLTDGAVGNEQQLLGSIAERLGDTRLHTIGIGSAPNTHLMRKMAQRGRGLCEFISSAGQAENRISAFFARLDRPVMTDVELEATGLEISERYPDPLPDLYAGQPLLVSARLVGESAEGGLRLGGWTRGGRIERRFAIDRPGPSDSGVAARWARAKIGSIMDSLHEGADPADVRRAVVELGLSFHLVTRYTSLVAVEEFATALGPASSHHVAGALPQGGTSDRLRLLLGLALGGLGLTLWALR